MISNFLKEKWTRAACLVDLSENHNAPKFIRDESIVSEQIELLLQTDTFSTANVNDELFWDDNGLRILINRAIKAQDKRSKIPAIQDALKAMKQSYDLAYENKTFGG